jgi:hypothetical protein
MAKTKHIPIVDPDEDLYIVPDTSEGAYTNCDCGDCREHRLADPDRMYFSAHELVDAWSDGWRRGAQKAYERMTEQSGDGLMLIIGRRIRGVIVRALDWYFQKIGVPPYE